MLTSYINRLQTIFGGKFSVFDEERIDWNTGNDICLVKNYQSTNYISSIQFGLQLEFYTNDVSETMKYLSIWTWEQHNQAFSLDGFPYVKQYVSQPVNNSNFIQVHENYIGTIVVNVTLMASFNLIDIKEAYVDNELFDPNQITFSYNTTTNNQRNNVEELNSSTINESNLQCQIVFPCDNTNFMRKARSIMFGQLNKNANFVIKVVFTDDVEYELDFRMSNKSFNKQAGVLSTNSITLIH